MNNEYVKNIIRESIEIKSNLVNIASDINFAATKIINCLENGGKVVIFGNGGSAADAQHIAAELSGKFYHSERKGLPAISLTSNTSSITAIGNDYGFEYIFSRQLEGLVDSKDVLIGISTSGNSENVIEGIKYGKKRGCLTIGLTGKSGKLVEIADKSIRVESDVTPRIQECHILVGHIICEIIDNHMVQFEK